MMEYGVRTCSSAPTDAKKSPDGEKSTSIAAAYEYVMHCNTLMVSYLVTMKSVIGSSFNQIKYLSRCISIIKQVIWGIRDNVHVHVYNVTFNVLSLEADSR